MKQQHALKKLKKDRRDFNLGQFYQLPALKDLPDEFMLPAPEIKHQKNTDFCTAFVTCLLSELQEGVKLNPAWSFAASKLISGDPESFGQDLRTAFKAHVKYGAIEDTETSMNVDNCEASVLRDIKNYPADLFEKAKKHKKQSFFAVKGPYDAFDNIRASIWLLKDFNQGVGSGTIWSFPSDNPLLPRSFTDNGSGHAIPYLGWKRYNGALTLIVPNSYGPEVGDRGYFYAPREFVNHFVDYYGAFVMVDISPEDAKKQLWGVLDRLKDVLMKILATLTPPTAPVAPVKPAPAPEPVPEPPPAPEALKWDTTTDARHSARVIMDTYKLSWDEKNLLCAVIKAESGFNTKIVNHQTKDYGICQINEYYWIGPGKYFASIEEVLNKPEKSVKFMIDAYKKGRLNWWVAYNNGSYKKYL